MNLSLASALLFILHAADSAVAPPAKADLQQAVERSLPFLQREGQAWISQRQCVSCHQVPFMVWSLSEAAHSGAAVDQEKLKETFAWSVDWQNWTAPANREKTDEAQAVSGNIDTMYQLLLAGAYLEDEQQPTWPAGFQKHLLDEQQEDGSWKACGQLPLQNRPQRETTDVTTAWALLAMSQSAPADESWEASLDSAQTWLDQSKPGESTEWWAVRLLLERTFGAQEKGDELLTQLLSHQRDDGGWGWLADNASDALGTGIALYALSQEPGKSKTTATAIQRAQRFLLDTQQEDGSWIVPSTLKRAKGEVKATSTYWGTAWAVIGLVRTSPDG